MRFIYAALVLGGLSACAPAIPDSGAGVGFDNSIAAQRAREAALSGAAPTASGVAPPMAVSSEPLSAAGTVPTQVPVQTQVQTPVQGTAMASATGMQPLSQPAPGQQIAFGSNETAEDIAAETAAALEAARVNAGVMPQQANSSGPASSEVNNPGISDENDFQAVSARESIQSDAERIARNRQLYTEVEPTAIPRRPGDQQPNIVEYALRTNNPRGAQLYKRSTLLKGRSERKCAKYGSADLAQMAFLDKGGPQRDRMGLDPDGDGYACNWDPAPFRQAVQN